MNTPNPTPFAGKTSQNINRHDSYALYSLLLVVMIQGAMIVVLLPFPDTATTMLVVAALVTALIAHRRMDRAANHFLPHARKISQ